MGASRLISARPDFWLSWRRWAPSSRRHDALRIRRPRLHPHRRQRECLGRRLHLHGRDDRDRHDPQDRHKTIPDPARRTVRGTATFDCSSLAWDTLDTSTAASARATLFATPYHDPRSWPISSPSSQPRVAVKESPVCIAFLDSIEPGAASKSYGIDVARLAGLLASVIERARRVLTQHEIPRSATSRSKPKTPRHLCSSRSPRRSRSASSTAQRARHQQPQPAPGADLLEELKSEIRVGGTRQSEHQAANIINMCLRQDGDQLLFVGLAGTQLGATERA